MSGLDQILKTQAALQSAGPQLGKLKQACQDMEAAFMKTLVSTMRKSAGQVHFGQQLGGDIYQDMFDDQLSEMLAAKQGAGLSSSMAKPMAALVLNQTISHQAQMNSKALEDAK